MQPILCQVIHFIHTIQTHIQMLRIKKKPSETSKLANHPSSSTTNEKGHNHIDSISILGSGVPPTTQLQPQLHLEPELPELLSRTSSNLEEKKSKKKKKLNTPNTIPNNTSNGETNVNSSTVSGTITSRNQQQAAGSRRQLELDAYASVITAFKAQGELTWKKETLLQDLRAILKISDDRHKMEAKRAEETLVYASIAPTTKKQKQPTSPAEIEDSDLSESSDKESLSDGERQLKKKLKLAHKDLVPLNSYPFPSAEPPAFVNKIPGETKSKKDAKDKKKAGRPKGKQPTINVTTTDQRAGNAPTSLNITLPPKIQDSAPIL